MFTVYAVGEIDLTTAEEVLVSNEKIAQECVVALMNAGLEADETPYSVAQLSFVGDDRSEHFGWLFANADMYTYYRPVSIFETADEADPKLAK